MTYRRYHYNCEPGCKILVAYARKGKIMKRIGQFYTKCGQFKLDKSLQSEEVIQKEPSVIISTTKMPEPYRPQISDEELRHLCNSLSRFKGW